MQDNVTVTAPSKQSFAALRNPRYRMFFITLSMAMMADSIEHVISYWVIFQKFHSQALGGFAVVSHWLPFLCFSVYSGALADRYDPRRMIQIGMLLFMSVSIGWGYFFYTDTLQMWHAMLLLVIHGFAGVFWQPATQLLIHDIVEPDELQSGVRLAATARYLGLLGGPALGGALMLALGPIKGIFTNTLVYLPTLLWMFRAPAHHRNPNKQQVGGITDIMATIRAISGNRPMLSMIVLSGAASLFVGNAFQAQMPGFAHDLGRGAEDFSYSMLLAADAVGALVGGIILESRGLLQAKPKTAFILAIMWCMSMIGFAAAGNYHFALLMLLAAGFLQLAFNAMAQTLVQLYAPPALRGKVIGLYTMSALGLRAFAGVSVGLLGSVIGIHWSLGLSAFALLIVSAGLLGFTREPAKASA